MTQLRIVLLLLVGFVMGCGGGGATAGDQPTPRSGGRVLTAQEMEGRGHGNLYEAVSTLRSAWVRGRPTTDVTGEVLATPQVFVDGVYRGDIEYLRQIQANDVESVQYLHAAEAAAVLPPMRTISPAVLVVLKRGPRKGALQPT
ncbi:MAG TPA: hypothetical protein VF584_23315 [Longimicrobium sp.]|jgi:hypothetical protein